MSKGLMIFLFLYLFNISIVNSGNIPHCEKEVPNGCAKCKDHFVSNGDGCYDCENGYDIYIYNNRNVCVPQILFCSDYDENDPTICKKCSMWKLSSNHKNCKADVTKENCEAEDADGNCTRCKIGYDLKGNECKLCPLNAKSCEFDANGDVKSFDCKQGYGPDKDKKNCKKCSDGCNKCKFFGEIEVCTQCVLEDNTNDRKHLVMEDDYYGYSLYCPKIASSRYLIASSLIALFLFVLF